MVYVPCAIAMAVGLRQIPLWRQLAPLARAGVVTSLGVVLIMLLGLWPPTLWNDYFDKRPVGLPGTSLLRLSDPEVLSFRAVTAAIREQCDTFYSAPLMNSLYIYAQLDPPTAQLRNVPGAHTAAEQREIVSDLEQAAEDGRRVCIVRDTRRINDWLNSRYGNGPLGRALAAYNDEIDVVGPFTISVRP
jgi:hypothetical protein